MTDEIKITAHIEPHRPDTCRLSVAREVHDGSAFFPDRESAKGSPLAEKLFELPETAGVRISGNDVTITKKDPENWRASAGRMAAIIREHLASGSEAVRGGYSAQFLSDEDLGKRVQEILDVEVNPAVASHGGFIELLDVKENKVFIKMGGGCQGCGMAGVTLRQGVEGALRKKLPQIDQILDSTDHASGANPYYAPSKK